MLTYITCSDLHPDFTILRLSDVPPPSTTNHQQQRHFNFSTAATSRLQQHLNDLSVRSGASAGDDRSSTTRNLADATASILPNDDLSVISELKTPETTSSSMSSGAAALTGHKVKEFR